jgi:hypothetical protein
MPARLACALCALGAVVLVGPRTAIAQHEGHGAHPGQAAGQRRGAEAMGVDQTTATHRFDDLPDGGRIILVGDPADSAGVRQIRAHLRKLATDFAAGDFTAPARTHGRTVPGTPALQQFVGNVGYAYEERPGGAAVRIRTVHPQALRAVRQFMAYQRMDHGAEGSVIPW